MKQIHRYKSLFPEMAKKKDDVIELVENLEYTINEHLFKLLIFPNTVDVEKWKKEIASKFIKIQLRKSRHNNWYLDKEKYFTILYTEPLDSNVEINKGDKKTFELYVINVIQENDKIKSIYDEDNFPFDVWNEKIVLLYRRLCFLLANGKITRNVVLHYIDEMILKRGIG